MQDVGQNGPENEVNPLIDNGFMYTTDGWGTVYKIDARSPGKASSSGSRIPGEAPGQRSAHPRHPLWEDLVIANLPDGRVIAINREKARSCGQAGRRQDRIRQQEKFLTAPLVAEAR